MELRHTYDLAVLLDGTQLARSSFYYHVKQLGKTDKYADIKGRIGYRRITLLLRQQGQLINHKTILRLMKDLKIKRVIRVKKYIKADIKDYIEYYNNDSIKLHLNGMSPVQYRKHHYQH